MILLALFAIIPQTDIADESVAMIELNHFYDQDGKHVLDQIIFYDWNPTDCRFDIRDWRLLKNPSQRPVEDFRRDRFTTTWQDGDTIRRVTAPHFMETWTQFDVELRARETLPKEQRRELINKRIRR